MTDFRVVICGGGVAALEGLLRLRKLAGPSLEVKLLAPNDQLVMRPLAVREAVALGGARRYPLWELVESAGAEWVKGLLASVDTRARLVHTGDGKALPYDALLIAVGGRLVADFKHVTTFRDAEAGKVYDRVVEDIEAGHARDVAFLVPDGPTYPLAVYELALMTAAHARRAGIAGLELSLVTPEPAPLAAFGDTAGAVVTELLLQAGVKLFSGAHAYPAGPRTLLVQPHGVALVPDRMVAAPRVTGPRIPGLVDGGPHGFIPLDQSCAVPGTDGRVFAAGDATAFPIKHGGLGAQQADTAAAGIAALAGADVEPAIFRPELCAKLLTGSRPLYLRATVAGGRAFDSEVLDRPPWGSDDKVIAEELCACLAGLSGAGVSR